MRLLMNRAVLSVEQDGIDASMIVHNTTEKVVAKTERSGDVAVGLFNPTTKPEVIATTASAIGLPGGGHYQLSNLWTHRNTRSGSTISATVPPHGVAFYQVSPIR
jgi:alpha-galactosidase